MLLTLVCVCVLSCAEEEDGNAKPLDTGGAGIGSEPGGGAGSSGGGGASDGSSKPPGSSGIETTGTDSSGTSGTESSPTGGTGTPTNTTSDICAALSIPLACCECLLVGEACVSALDSCEVDPDCACVTFCWFGGQGGFDDCVDTCGAITDALVVDLRTCIDAACPVCLS